MNATRPSQNTTISTRKHTLFDADVATTPARSNFFCSTNHLDGSPTKKHYQKDVFGESQRMTSLYRSVVQGAVFSLIIFYHTHTVALRYKAESTPATDTNISCANGGQDGEEVEVGLVHILIVPSQAPPSPLHTHTHTAALR